MIDILAYHTQKTHVEIENSIQRDLWLSPEEAKTYGIVDHIVNLPKLNEKQKSNGFEL